MITINLRKNLREFQPEGLDLNHIILEISQIIFNNSTGTKSMIYKSTLVQFTCLFMVEHFSNKDLC